MKQRNIQLWKEFSYVPDLFWYQENEDAWYDSDMCNCKFINPKYWLEQLPVRP